MNKKMIVIMVILFCCFVFSFTSIAEMESENYQLRNSVLSSGGASSHSSNHHIDATMGQPSPLMDPLYPPLSDGYDLYPGFWYTSLNIHDTCMGDFDGDGDVDGADLADYLFDDGGIAMAIFAENFGKDSCP